MSSELKSNQSEYDMNKQLSIPAIPGYYRILAPDHTVLGNVYIDKNGGISIHNDYEGLDNYPDSAKNAWFYILTRMTDKPSFEQIG